MTGIMIFGLIALSVASFFFYMKSKKLEENQGPPKLLTSEDEQKLDLLKLKIDDVVSYFGEDYVVEGRLDYNEDGWPWVTYMLVGDEDEIKWLSVEDDDRIEASLWVEIDMVITGERPPEFLEWQGEKFKLVEYGRADVTQTGKTGNKTGLSTNYYEYKGSENLLSVEQWGQSFEVSIGQDVNTSALELFRV